MLILSRCLHEVIRVSDDMQIVILGITEKVISLGIDVPKNIPVQRKEIYRLINPKAQEAQETGGNDNR